MSKMPAPVPSDVSAPPRDHGGGVDAACARYGGARRDWIDLSTGINPQPYPVPALPARAWTDLPDRAAQDALAEAARQFWAVPEGAQILAAPGASALIARIPGLLLPGRVAIPGPTYNEHAAAFRGAGWQVDTGPEPKQDAPARVVVHPNNPDGRLWSDLATPGRARLDLLIIDESFCDICPEDSLVHLADQPGVIVLKSFGKFWGLAGLRLGFAIAAPQTITALSEMLGPWPVSGPALEVGAAALRDPDWAQATRTRLSADADRMDALLTGAGARVAGGTPLFRLYDVDDAAAWQDRLARHHIWSRIFPYSATWLRLGLPPADGWTRLEQALA